MEQPPNIDKAPKFKQGNITPQDLAESPAPARRIRIAGLRGTYGTHARFGDDFVSERPVQPNGIEALKAHFGLEAVEELPTYEEEEAAKSQG